MSDTRIAMVHNETPGRLRVQTSKNPLKKGNVTEMGPGVGSSSSIKIPLCRDQGDFERKGHVDIYTMRVDQQDSSGHPPTWTLEYQIWQDGETVRFSVGASGYSTDGLVLGEARVGGNNTLTVVEKGGFSHLEMAAG